jgi:hypothetical protein
MKEGNSNNEASGPTPAPDRAAKKNVAGSAAGRQRSQNIQRPNLKILRGSEQSSAAISRRATGPRTVAGKKRSSRNALKSGIFSKVLLQRGGSLAEYEALVSGLMKDFHPQGTTEVSLVKDLAWVFWRKRRSLLAENAEIASTIGFKALDSDRAQAIEAWDQSRTGETSGGMLRDASNPFVLRDAAQILMTFRNLFEETGFRKGEDPWRLRKLYGLDHDGSAPSGIFRTYTVYEKIATANQTASQNDSSPDELKKEMIGMLDKEIARLKCLEMMGQFAQENRQDYDALAALIPSQVAMDRFLRYEAHLSREFDRILNRLERVQRMRRGQAGPPTLKVEING